MLPSPSASTSDLMSIANQEAAYEEPEKMSRLHRRLSMETMRQERERQERLQEKHRRTAENDERNRQARNALKGKGHASQRLHAHLAASDQPNAEPKHGAAVAKHPGKSLLPSGYSTARLIGHIATDVDDDVRIPRQTEFPELRGRKGKAKKFAGMLNRSAQPLLDILHRPTSAGADQPAKEAAPPSRIPVIRSQPGSDARHAVNRPVPMRPPNARNSHIPRPPNMRSRAASPEDEHGSSASNVFLRLARRLNSRGQPNIPSVLGTVPRKMDLLLPAAARYISQHPKQPSAPQVQVFYTKPKSEESGSIKGTPPRRHSYQISAEAGGAGSVSSQGVGSHGGRHRSAYPRLPLAMSDNDDADNDDADMEDGQPESYGERHRYRSATVSQVQMQQSASDSTRSQPPSDQAYIVPRKSRETLSAGLPSDQNPDNTDRPHKERKHSISLRPSNIIPTITRRLGLGFGFKSSANKDSSTSAAATDDESVSNRLPRSRVSSAGTSSLHERGLIPPRL
ncbi:hypothetical protein GGH98_004906, partial [Coemansia sp. RSA 454]